MRARPKSAANSSTTKFDLDGLPSLPLLRDPTELRREPCEDEDGNRYTVIVWRPYPELEVTEYTLEDGSPVSFVDDCLFEIERTGVFVTRCA